MWIVRLALRCPCAFVVAALSPFCPIQDARLIVSDDFRQVLLAQSQFEWPFANCIADGRNFFRIRLVFRLFCSDAHDKKSNAASGTHCRREHELAQKKLTVVSSRFSAVPPKIKFDNYSWSC
jgi:hypothetical protein